MGKSGAWKTGHCGHNVSAKGGGNKGVNYTSTYASREYCKKQLTDKYETTTIMLHVGYINKTTTLCIPIYEEWIHATTEDHDLRYIKQILSGP